MVLTPCTYFSICFQAKPASRILFKIFRQRSQSPALSSTKGRSQPFYATSSFILANFGEARFERPPNGFSFPRDMPPVVSPPVARYGEPRRSRTMSWKNCIVHMIGNILNHDEGGSNEQCLPSIQRETIQSRQSVSKLNKDTDYTVAKQILCKSRVCVAL
jgi:hypothetical protein